MENKKQTGIWIDGSKAVIVSFFNGEQTTTQIKSEIENPVHHQDEGRTGTFMGRHHISHESAFEERKKHQVHDYIGEVMAQIHDAEEVFIFGPGETKLALEKEINAIKLDKKTQLKATEAADKMTLNQVVAHTKAFYNL